jgi:hypothetical protein
MRMTLKSPVNHPITAADRDYNHSYKIKLLMKQTVICFLLSIYSLTGHSQVNPDSCSMEISLLTCAPGSDLYSIFGHTAIRVQDTRRGMDVVYNYGTFDDSDPLFYTKFMRGIMRYSLSAETFENFMQEYEYEHRTVVAQILHINCSEKKILYEALRTNTLEENRFYDYHFHTDNCTTRAGKIIASHAGGKLTYKNILPYPPPSYRDMIHEYLDPQHKDWSEFGIDMFLGRHLDINPSNEGAIYFLPDYLFKGMDSAIAGNQPLVQQKQVLLTFPYVKKSAEGLTPKALLICLLLATIILFLFRESSAIAKTLLIFDIGFFTLLGLSGILMAAMWLGRVDDVCRNNINILWALPTHGIAVFFIRKRKPWIKYYFLITGILAALLLTGFPWWPQRMNTAVIPLLAIIIFRSLCLYINRNHAEKNNIPG